MVVFAVCLPRCLVSAFVTPLQTPYKYKISTKFLKTQRKKPVIVEKELLHQFGTALWIIASHHNFFFCLQFLFLSVSLAQ